jgi:O-antigen ligase
LAKSTTPEQRPATQRGLQLTLHTLISFALFIIFYTGFQGGRYYIANRVQELGLLSAMSLFFYGAIVTSLNLRTPDLRWNWWFFSTLFFIAYTFILPAYIFSVNADVAMMPSVMASREFLIIFLAPAIWFLYRLGFDIEKIERIFVISLVVLAFNYIFHYFRLDLRAAYFSSDHTLAALVTYDPWRGYRLKPSSMALFTLSILGPMLLFTSQRWSARLGWLLVVILLGYIWMLVQARSMAASLVLAVMSYPFFFAERRRLGLLFFALPVIVLGTATMIMVVADHMAAGGENEAVRLRSYSIAWESIKETPFFGFGQQSNFTKTEQEIFWYKFFSSDLGIIGITFKYGFVGASVYVFFTFFLLQRLVRTLWLYKAAYGRLNPVLYSLTIIFIVLLINMILNPALGYIQGLTTASFAIGLTSAWRHKLGNCAASATADSSTKTVPVGPAAQPDRPGETKTSTAQQQRVGKITNQTNQQSRKN